MVILFKSDKSLVITSKSTVFQNENLADKLNIYVPTFYDDHDISLFTATLFYKDGGNELHIETLESAESDKENYLKYVLPVTTDITQKAGTVELWLGLSYSDPEEEIDVKIHSDSVSVIVEKYDEYTVSHTVSDVDTKLSVLEEKIDTLIASLTPSEDSQEPTSDPMPTPEPQEPETPEPQEPETTEPQEAETTEPQEPETTEP